MIKRYKREDLKSLVVQYLTDNPKKKSKELADVFCVNYATISQTLGELVKEKRVHSIKCHYYVSRSCNTGNALQDAFVEAVDEKKADETIQGGYSIKVSAVEEEKKAVLHKDLMHDKNVLLRNLGEIERFEQRIADLKADIDTIESKWSTYTQEEIDETMKG